MFLYGFGAYVVCVSMNVQNNMRISRTRVQAIESIHLLLVANSWKKNIYVSNMCAYYKSMRFAFVFN